MIAIISIFFSSLLSPFIGEESKTQRVNNPSGLHNQDAHLSG